MAIRPNGEFLFLTGLAHRVAQIATGLLLGRLDFLALDLGQAVGLGALGGQDGLLGLLAELFGGRFGAEHLVELHPFLARFLGGGALGFAGGALFGAFLGDGGVFGGCRLGAELLKGGLPGGGGALRAIGKGIVESGRQKESLFLGGGQPIPQGAPIWNPRHSRALIQFGAETAEA